MGKVVSRPFKYEIINYLETDDYSLKFIYDNKKAKTEPYKEVMNVFRRGTFFELHFKAKKKQTYSHLNIRIRTQNGPGGTEDPNCYGNAISYFDFSKRFINNHECIFKIDISINAAVGWYRLYVVDEENPITDILPWFIIFNPFHPSDEVYTPNNDLIDNYLFDTTTAVHYGSENNYYARKYKLKQFSAECLIISSVYLCRMNLVERESAVQVSRAIADFVNSSNGTGLMSTKACDITDGRHPGVWSNMMDIYHEYLDNESQSVSWGNYFVFAGLITAFCRCVGIVCRTVTGFSIGYNDYNDALINSVLSANDLTLIKNSGILWDVHCWNNVIIKSNVPFEANQSANQDNLWQHLDGTRENINKGFFKYGPYPLILLKNGISKTDIIDGRFIYSSLNTIIKYSIMNESGETLKEFNKKSCGKLFLTSKGKKESIDISNEYRTQKIKGNRNPNKNDLVLELNVDKMVEIGAPLKYSIKVRNSSENAKSLICITVQFRNQHNIDSLIEQKSKSFEFRNKNTDFNGVMDLLPVINHVDVSQMCFCWELRFFDEKLNKLKIIRKTTAIKPILQGSFTDLTNKYEIGSTTFLACVKNKSKYLLKDIKIVIFLDVDLKVRREICIDLEPNDEKGFLLSIDHDESGMATFIGVASYGLSVYKFGEIRVIIR